MNENLMRSQGTILAVIAGIILLILIVAAVKGGGKGCGWLIALAIAGLVAYLQISGEILK